MADNKKRSPKWLIPLLLAAAIIVYIVIGLIINWLT